MFYRACAGIERTLTPQRSPKRCFWAIAAKLARSSSLDGPGKTCIRSSSRETLGVVQLHPGDTQAV
jgi:hypothetical protein